MGYPSRIAAPQPLRGQAVGTEAWRNFDAGAAADPRRGLEPEFPRFPRNRTEAWRGAPHAARRGRRKDAGGRVWLLACAMLIMASGTFFLAVVQRASAPRIADNPQLVLPQVTDDGATGSTGALLVLAEASLTRLRYRCNIQVEKTGSEYATVRNSSAFARQVWISSGFASEASSMTGGGPASSPDLSTSVGAEYDHQWVIDLADHAAL